MLYVIRSVVGACAALLLFATQSVRAQDTWTAITPPTTQALWGITYSPAANLFVSVGEGGTILTSPDGVTWTARASGTSQWLLAVTYSQALQRYVVVGDQGLVLTSSDAITWTTRTSGTAQRLNGVAANPGATASVGFLAVGEAGTVLTSADGSTWTPHTIANAGWLRGVIFGSGRFVISGQVRTTTTVPNDYAGLFTTRDGVTFTPETMGLPTTLDLEALTFDGTQFGVAGRNVVALSPASATLEWKTRVREQGGLSTPAFRVFRGVAFFNNAWVAVGALVDQAGNAAANQPIVYAQPNSPAQNATGIVASASLNAIAAGPSVAVAVGAGGSVWRSTATATAPTPFLLAASSTVVAASGSTVALAADARGSAPMTFQWNFNGQPVTGATTATLTLPSVTAAQSGAYTLTATNSLGAATSAPYFLTVVSSVTVPAPVDPTFVSTLNAEPDVVAVQADGRPLLFTRGTAGTNAALLRLNLDGSRDTTFQPQIDAAATSFELLSDGRMLIGKPDTGSARFVRLNTNGSSDAAYSLTLSGGTHQFLADGRLVNLSVSNNTVSFIRFKTDGSADDTYTQPALVLALPNQTGFDASFTQLYTRPTASGHIMVVAVSQQAVGTGVFGRNQSKLFRLLPDGTLDQAYPIVTLEVAIDQFVVVGDQFHYRAWSASALGSVRSYIFWRLNADGSYDLSYHAPQFNGSVSGFPVLQLGPDGSIYQAEARSRVIRHYLPNGLPDYDFSAMFTEAQTFTRLFPLDDGRLVVTGAFTQLNGVPTRYLARLLPDRRVSATRLTNISVRQLTGTGSQTLIVGFVVHGQGDKPLLLRAVGPTLANYGVTNPLADPKLALFESSGTARLTNDNWSDRSNAALIAGASTAAGAFALPSGSKDAAALTSLGAGAYTAQVGTDGPTGIALLEGYDTGGLPSDRLAARVINFSARANSGTAENALIAGFTISGPSAKRVLIRAVGPGLIQFGVTGVLADPQLTLYQNNTAVAANDNWSGDAELAAAFTSSGAFPLANPSSKDAALLATLPPGSYTAQVNGVGNTTGVALVEVYEVP